MPYIEHQRSTKASQIDVLDRVLDKGIVIDAWRRLSVVGIDLVTARARVVVASFETYQTYAPLLQSVADGAPRVSRDGNNTGDGAQDGPSTKAATAAASESSARRPRHTRHLPKLVFGSH
jgi:gas vesicle structural protein